MLEGNRPTLRYSAMSRSFWTIRLTSERKGQWAPTPLRYVRLSDVVGANRGQPAIADLQLTMECNKPFSLPAVLRAETSAAEDKNHWMLSLQFGELLAIRGVIGELIIGELTRGQCQIA